MFFQGKSVLKCKMKEGKQERKINTRSNGQTNAKGAKIKTTRMREE
jgi:hypothetical protein